MDKQLIYRPTDHDIYIYAMPAGMGAAGRVRGSTPPTLTSVTPVTYADFIQYDPPVTIQATSSTASFTNGMVIREGGPGGTELSTTFVNASTLTATTLGAHRTNSVFRTSGSKTFDVCLPGGGNPSNSFNITVTAFNEGAKTGIFDSNPSDTTRSGSNLTSWKNAAYSGTNANMNPLSGTWTVTDNDSEVVYSGGGNRTTISTGSGSLRQTDNLFFFLSSHTTWTFVGACKPNNTNTSYQSRHNIGTWNIGTLNSTTFTNNSYNSSNGCTRPYVAGNWHAWCASIVNTATGTIGLGVGRAGQTPSVTTQGVNFSGYPGLGGAQLDMGVADNAFNGKFLEFLVLNEVADTRRIAHWVNRMYVKYPTPFSF